MWRRSLLSICIQKTEGKEKLEGNKKPEEILYKGDDHDKVKWHLYVEEKLHKPQAHFFGFRTDIWTASEQNASYYT